MTRVIVVLYVIIAFSLSLSLLTVSGLGHYIRFVDQVTLLPGVSVACAALIAALSYVRDIKHQAAERQRKSDEIYLNIAKDSFSEVVKLLKDLNNDRVIWIRAARLLLNSRDLKTKIKTSDVKDAFEVAEERLRSELYRTLSVVLQPDGEPEPLPPAFFYGIQDRRTETSLDNAAIKGGSQIVVGSLSIHKIFSSPPLKALDPKSVVAIFDFLELPQNFSDPLVNIEVWDEPWEKSHGRDQGARRFVSHNRDHFAIDGKLVAKAKRHGKPLPS